MDSPNGIGKVTLTSWKQRLEIIQSSMSIMMKCNHGNEPRRR